MSLFRRFFHIPCAILLFIFSSDSLPILLNSSFRHSHSCLPCFLSLPHPSSIRNALSLSLLSPIPQSGLLVIVQQYVIFYGSSSYYLPFPSTIKLSWIFFTFPLPLSHLSPLMCLSFCLFVLRFGSFTSLFGSLVIRHGSPLFSCHCLILSVSCIPFSFFSCLSYDSSLVSLSDLSRFFPLTCLI